MNKRIGSKDSIREPPSVRIHLSAAEAEGQPSEETEALKLPVMAPDGSHEPMEEEETKDATEKQLKDETSKTEVIEEIGSDADNTPVVLSHLTTSYISGNWLTRAAAAATGWVLELLHLRDTDPRYHIIVDTSMVLQTLMNLYTVRSQLLALAGQDMMLVFPRIMMQELEHIKTADHINPDLQARGREAGRIIEEWDEAGLAFLQDEQDMEKSFLTFRKFKCENNDDKIIHTALQYKYSYGKKNVGVFSMDRLMRGTVRPMKFRTFCIRTPDEAKILAEQKAARAVAKRRKASKASQQSVSQVLAIRAATTAAAAPAPMKPHRAKREEDIKEYFKTVFDRIIVVRDSARMTLSSTNSDKKKRALAVQSLRLLHSYVTTICTQFSSTVTSARTGTVFNPAAALHDTLTSFVVEYNVQVEEIDCGLLHRLCADDKMKDMADGGLSEMRDIIKTVDDVKRFLSPDEMF